MTQCHYHEHKAAGSSHVMRSLIYKMWLEYQDMQPLSSFFFYFQSMLEYVAMNYLDMAPDVLTIQKG